MIPGVFARRTIVAFAASLVTALLIGVPTDLIATPLFQRMTPSEPWQLPVLVVTSILAGLVAATSVGAPTPACTRRAASGGVLSFLAVGCPVCNKLVLVLLGTSGATSLFAPVQPLLAVAGIILLLSSLAIRGRRLVARQAT